MNTKQEILRLLEKNKKALLKELHESEELIHLLKKSISTDLTAEEKKKVREQLFDICKIIPAFAIFLLPGGALLLPLLVKFIPSILPSAYRDEDL
ncbi:MAG: hypothetical protein KGV59_05695 [Tenacibaculum sp.]|nr:hypothetical protein [Tenacibaculum sp.]